MKKTKPNPIQTYLTAIVRGEETAGGERRPVEKVKEVSGKHRMEWTWTPKEAAGAGYGREDAVLLAQTATEEHLR